MNDYLVPNLRYANRELQFRLRTCQEALTHCQHLLAAAAAQLPGGTLRVSEASFEAHQKYSYAFDPMTRDHIIKA